MATRPALSAVLLLTARMALSFVVDPAKDVPVAHQVDVVVVGGTTGAVAAAVAAAGEGAGTFLVAPRPYLGEDMAGTLRLWLEEGETPSSPLASQMFSPEARMGHEPRPVGLPLTYEADLPSAPRHKDKAPPSLLTDGNWHSAAGQSVQYDGDVSVVADLGQAKAVGKVTLYVYHRVDYSLASVAVSTSVDGEAWRDRGVVENPHPAQASPYSAADPISLSVDDTVRFVKFTAKRADSSARVLRGEIEIAPTQPEPVRQADIERMAIRPLHLKKTLDEALLEADVPFLLSSCVTSVLRDSAGRPAGVVMANRSGRQAVLAKVIIDATAGGWVSRMAGANPRDRGAGEGTFTRVVIGGEPRDGEGVSWRRIDPPLHFKGRRYPVIEYTLSLPAPEDSVQGWAELEQKARDLTYHPDQQFASEVLFRVPRFVVPGVVSSAGPWRGVAALPLGAFRAKDAPGVYVLGGAADVSREQAVKLVRPCALIELGTRVGSAAGAEGKEASAPVGVRLAGDPVPAGEPAGEVSECFTWRGGTTGAGSVRQEAGCLPVLGEYDVVVVGGGTSGAPAGIGAQRNGPRTLVIEYLHSLGGVGTMGAISKYYHGYRGGFSAEVPGGSSWQIEQRAEWWRSTLRAAGARIWFRVLGCGAVVRDGRVTGVVVATPRGRGVVLARTVIDATGNADVAAAAGAPCVYTDGSDIAVQGTGLPPRNLGASYTNTDFTLTDETDARDVTSLFVYAKSKYPRASFDQGQLIDTRERRRIVGEHTLTILDQVNGRTYADTIAQTKTNYDTHGYTIDPYFTLDHPPSSRGFQTFIPYRCLLPQGLDGLLVVGLGLSVHRDSVPLIRMQPDVQNTGYAAGVIAATVYRTSWNLREVDLRGVQRHLADKGCLPESVLEHEDSYPISDERLREAVRRLEEARGGVALLLASPERARPLLRRALAEAEEGEARLLYAQVLAVLGDAAGVPRLVEAVRSQEGWDKGWNYRAMGQFGSNMSPLDSLIFALGMARDRRATAAVLEKAELLDAEADFSHHRAVALALERLGGATAAGALAALLAKPGMAGHVLRSIAEARTSHTELDRSLTALAPRRLSLREITLARALFRCGDRDGVGRSILDAYTRDVRGHFARHAAAVLRESGR